MTQEQFKFGEWYDAKKIPIPDYGDLLIKYNSGEYYAVISGDDIREKFVAYWMLIKPPTNTKEEE